jgi:hypothetical protein
MRTTERDRSTNPSSASDRAGACRASARRRAGDTARPQAFPASNSSMLRGQSSFSSRDSERSASTRPPV